MIQYMQLKPYTLHPIPVLNTKSATNCTYKQAFADMYSHFMCTVC